MTPRLSVLCVTRYEDHAKPFIRKLMQLVQLHPSAELVLGADGDDAWDVLADWCPEAREEGITLRVYNVTSRGFIESVLDEVLAECTGDYVLRIDDDEACSPALVQWLCEERYLHGDHWKFSRAHLWPDKDHYIVDLPLWPDHQTRLSVKAKAGGQRTIHAGSPHGGGQLAPAVIEHHKFLVRTEAERKKIAQRYDQVMPGAGTSPGMISFQLPELAEVAVVPYRDGGFS
jgi:hypothetical protein